MSKARSRRSCGPTIRRSAFQESTTRTKDFAADPARLRERTAQIAK